MIIRISPAENSALAIFVCREESNRIPAAAAALREKVPETIGVLWSQVRSQSVVRRKLAKLVTGEGKLTQKLGEWSYTVSAESFFQVNNEQGARLLALVNEYTDAQAHQLVIDGYCGVGTFLIPLGKKSARILGIEEHPVAISDAQENLARFALHGCRLFEGQMENVVTRLAAKGRTVDTVVLDPPRKGVGPVVLENITRMGAKRVIMVSCDPATLGRDAGCLVKSGFHISAVQPLDMFPQTWHVETVLLAER